MIVQVTLTRDEGFLIKELLPVWKKYADGFVFLVDSETSDNTREILKEKQKEYNILEVIEMDKYKLVPEQLETTLRQTLFDTAYKYSSKIICLDTDEYLDGSATKEQLENILDNNPDTLFYLQWIQYTCKNQRRVDMFWRDVFHERIGSYTINSNPKYGKSFSHTSHLPGASKAARIDPSQLFVAHLQWLDKRWAGIKQYYWKVWDFVNHKEMGVNIINKNDYDVSVNNFNWGYENISCPLKIDEKIYSTQDVKGNTKLKYIVKQTQKHNVPNLGDWGMGIYDYAIGKNCISNNKLSICITTFKERENLVKQLITNIRKYTHDHDIILLVNGNNEEKMDETYRKNILSFCATINNCYPILCPEFKSLSKLWNTGVIFSNTEYNLVLNDDTKIENPDSFKIITEYINNTKAELFTINGMFSHFVVTKTLLHRLNYFDERLIAFGEEDGDFVHRYILNYKKDIPSLFIKDFNNTHAYDLTSKNLETYIDNKPCFNREFANLMYKEDPTGIRGKNPVPIKKVIESKQQYPYEIFVQKNKHNIKHFNKIINEYD